MRALIAAFHYEFLLYVCDLLLFIFNLGTGGGWPAVHRHIVSLLLFFIIHILYF